MWCPTCRAEYRNEISLCADCGTALVDALPPVPSWRDRHPAITGPFSPDDDVVELLTTTALEAEVTAAHLRSDGIDAVVFGVDPFSGYGAAFQNAQGARIMVRRADVASARMFVAQSVDPTPQPRSTVVRAVALFALLLVAIPVVASFPQVFLVIVLLGFVALAVQLLPRKARKA